MINYWPLKYETPDMRRRTVDGLRCLRKLIGEAMPEPSLHDTLVLGTWNIRNFDDNRFGHGPRIREAMYFLAETISAFDVLAVQELCRDLGPLRQLMRLLGPQYDYIVTDVAEQDGGNRERLGFIYNRAKVRFKGVAGEMVLPVRDLIEHGDAHLQPARSPFGCEFQAGWFRFLFTTVHIYFGKESQGSPEYARRVAEIDAVAANIAARAEKEPCSYILVGDFNIDKMGDPSGNALIRNGFQAAQNNVGSNADRTKFYDQISWLPRKGTVRQTRSARNQGVLDVLSAVMDEDRFPDYRQAVEATVRGQLDKARTERAEALAGHKDTDTLDRRIAKLDALLADPAGLRDYYLTTWRTFQVSDHLPLWVELSIDFSAEYLTRLRNMSGTLIRDNVDIPM
ncbi:Endonuclease/exonuclease/phosphatase [Pseudodesulfovibrio mercurii]|uniref:Endonuclease/exonuclease/phosphatase n=1 Tax=Pseudodesulfovibrio mercurii TaxID=641491 RepID=F0JFW2_9BACT|nr:endonuclease/exonuclease/phosphatase family protein [Pseudodesulfovibrio mercurii]EGB14958.1 Endonuclease/exonuclease/phosphatase [Pseudodesulfovibrio mercurii]